MGFYSNILRISIPVVVASLTISCGSAPKAKNAPAPAAAAASESAKDAAEAHAAQDSAQATIEDLTRRLEDIELRLSTIVEKVNFAQTGVEQMLRGGAPVTSHPASSRGVPVPA